MPSHAVLLVSACNTATVGNINGLFWQCKKIDASKDVLCGCPPGHGMVPSVLITRTVCVSAEQTVVYLCKVDRLTQESKNAI